ncbi:hypothetical protein LUZ60_012404 [Juncus effusus]|nr:hypothetical protein LUZ60_012404 [Juncus effusus]
MANRVKEDEKNEKIIRGLMKLPANRRCINCNNLGPQYVCTNFSTFICTNCSGVHREFTHRVKSVSMAKFTSQEVAALQEGGNERAREIFFKEWEPQRNAFPDSSNIDKLRDFIRHVYEERRFSGERRAPKPKAYNEEPSSETRRPPPSDSSYRGGSRSPPYTDRYVESPYSSRGSNDGRNPRNSYGDRSPPDYSNDGRNPRSSYGDRSPPDYRRSPQQPQQIQSEKQTKPQGGSPNYQRDDASSPPVAVRPVRDILGPDAPPLRVNEPPPKANGVAKPIPAMPPISPISPPPPISPISPPPPQVERTSSASSTPSARTEPATQPTIQPPVQPSVQPTAAPAPQPDILSLIDFTSDPDPPAPAQQPPSNPNPNPNPNSESGGWAAFDAFGGRKPVTQQNNNSQVDLGLGQLSLSGSSPVKRADVSPNSVEAALFDAIAAAPTNQQQNVTQPTNPANLSPPQENAAAAGRKELPQDFFTSLYPPATAQMPGWQRGPQYMGYAMQYPAGMVMPTYPQQPQMTYPQAQPVKSANPFDIADPAPAQQGPTYPTVAPPNMNPNMNIPNMNMNMNMNMNVGPQQGTSPRWMVPPQQMHAHPSQYMMQQMPGNIPQQMPNNMYPLMQQGGLSQVNTGFADPNIQNRYSQPNTPNNSFGTVGGTNPFG